MSNRVWFDQYYRNFAPIFEDYDLLMLLDFHYYKEHNFDLAKMHMALYAYFGGHNNYDDYKCSFAYKFKLTIERDGKKYAYGMQLFDMKGNMPYFAYYRKPDEGKSANYYHTPLDEECSKEDMRYCTMTFISFMVGFYQGYQPYFNQPFYRINRAGYL